MAGFYKHRAPLPLESARVIVEQALRAARGRELKPMTVVVVDAGGHPIAVEREDGAGTVRFEVARGKASAALGVGSASGAFGAANTERPAFLASVAAAAGEGAVPVAGGVLVLDDEERIIGAVGVSGDASDADEAVAVAGIEAAGLRAGAS
ncbi:GlcG/HbpS family heme-binding protein [Arhodomonas sp. SL1]|uniref:GlcG/HbpS family heme-binding protein n=1 Tax=Arhodomonas sp. SL1 TaxID=3425691 RepID=UPI003F8828B3